MLKQPKEHCTESFISNQYYLLLADRGVVEWDIYRSDYLGSELMWAAYLSKTLQIVEQSLSGSGLIFYLTREELNHLPCYGENVVVIIAADEWCRMPMYAHRVLAIFKSYGTKPFLGCNPFLEPSYANFASLAQYLRIYLACFPRSINYKLQTWKHKFLGSSKISKIYTIPLGYYNQLETPVKQISERTYDVFFAGSVLNYTYIPGSLKSFLARLLTPPKIQSRQTMISYLRQFQEQFSNFRVELSLTSGFYLMTPENIQTYAERLMNSKICLIPRGTSYETYRFFEAIRFGCIPVVEALPPHWFYDNSLGIKVKNWHNLSETLEMLLTDQELLQSKHQKALWWWQNKCSEVALGKYMVSKLEESKTL